MTKFNHIKTHSQYLKTMEYLDNQVLTCQALPDSVLRESYYCTLIADRDDLIEHAIYFGLSGKDFKSVF